MNSPWTKITDLLAQPDPDRQELYWCLLEFAGWVRGGGKLPTNAD